MNFFENINISDLLRNFAGYIDYRGPITIIRALIDISIVSYVIYKVIVLIRETRAWQLVKGILLIIAAAELSKLLGLKTIAYLFNNTVSIIAFALVVLFQPELRRGLEQIGRSRFRDIFGYDDSGNKVQVTATIEEIIKACTELAHNYTGALIIIERETKVGDIINTGTQLDSNVSSELLQSIFNTESLLHDGAVIIRNNRIKAAACYLPLTENPNLSKDLGTRHRAALGISEVSDSVAVVVSEQSGRISFAQNGGLTRNLAPDMLRKALYKNLMEKESPNKKISIWKQTALVDKARKTQPAQPAPTPAPAPGKVPDSAVAAPQSDNTGSTAADTNNTLEEKDNTLMSGGEGT